MQFEDRFYSGKNHRPRPDIYKSADSHRIMIVTFWGESTVRENLTSKLNDLLLVDYKSLRTELVNFNTWVLEEINKENYLCQIEILVITKLGDLFHWIQVGQPSVLMVDPLQGLVPLSLFSSFEMTEKAPLVFEGLGVDNNILSREGYTQYKQFILFQGHGVNLNSYTEKNYSLQNLTQVLSLKSNESSFWIAQLQF